MAQASVAFSKKHERKQWPDTVSRADLQAMHWKPLSFNEFVVKIHSRCNLACDYCYMYEMADTSWRSQPRVMSSIVATKTAERIREHAEKHHLSGVHVILHGGEPLLVGARRLRELLEIFEMTIQPASAVRFSVQTNGLLLTDSITEVLSDYFVDIAVSLDGGRDSNDRHRVFRNGAGSYELIAERLNALSVGPAACLFSGFLATIDLANDPVDVYESLRLFDPPGMDFLLPLATWDSPPPGCKEGKTPYADWLITLFDHWMQQPKTRPSIRWFDEVIALYKGRNIVQEARGLAPMRFSVVQTDGSYELVDSLRVAFDGAAVTGLHVFSNSLDDLAQVPPIAVRQVGARGLSQTCQRCEHVQICGGGLYAHRFRDGSGFLNESVYCADLAKLLSHIRCAVLESGHVSPAP